ncbi:MAG: HAD hydrolase family protein [Deltaproteobacteria bacterium]|nr:HAD hydrolase family protein [Deltaproteobacteria bacterium]
MDNLLHPGAQPSSLPSALRDLAAHISLVILDVDGVLTDGTLVYGEQGEVVKQFNAKDGLGIRLMQSVGIEVAVITARKSPILARRMTDLRIKRYYTGYDNKINAYNALLQDANISPDHIAYVGDDILDLPVMRKVMLPIAVRDAHFVVKNESKWVVDATGGHGAVREVADGLIAARTNLVDAYNEFLRTHVGCTGLEDA